MCFTGRYSTISEGQGKLLIVAPNDTCGVDTLTKDREALRKFYNKGYHDANAIPKSLRWDFCEARWKIIAPFSVE